MTDLRVPHRAIGLRSCPGTVKGGTVSASSDTPPDLNVDTLAAAGVVPPPRIRAILQQVDGIDADLVLPYGWAATAERPVILDELADGLRASQGQNPCTGHRARSTARRRAGASRTLLV